mgnify:CR=1 FL=1
MSILQKLTEGVVNRDVSKEGAALLNKWQATGLLEGLGNDQHAQSMAVLLENQAKELLREASSMGASDVEGFAAVAFPIVRRVFGGLIANDLVSVQAMSLPSGLIFFLDFVRSDDSPLGRLGDGASVYGGNKVASQIQQGVDLGDESASTISAGQFYNLDTGYSHATGSVAAAKGDGVNTYLTGLQIDTVQVNGKKLISALTEAEKKLINFDPDLLALNGADKIAILDCDITKLPRFNRDATMALDLGSGAATDASKKIKFLDHANAAAVGNSGADVRHIKRLTQVLNDTTIRVVLIDLGGADIEPSAGETFAANDAIGVVSYPIADEIVEGGALGAVKGQATAGLGFDLEGSENMAEIDIKVDSIAVTAMTKKLKAKWTPELGQDLNAYHNLDAEVELTGILSEQIALEIDREILSDLVQGATAATRYWSRAPGLFVDSTGAEIGHQSAAPDFTGTVSEWYETLIETINDVSAQIHRKTLRGGANFVVCSPEVANILEFTSGFRASVTHDADRGTIGAVNVGSLSKKFDVYVDPYFLRNVILVGRKGSSFLESGFVYAPYVPLQVTPTIFGTEDFVPRKGVMTRYAKKMVRPDMYGLVVVRGLLGEAGKTAA